MNRHNTILLILIFVLTGIGWLAFQRFPNIAYMTSDYTSITGWTALTAGWPVYGFVLTLATLIGLLLGGWIGQNSRERDAAESLASRQAELKGQQLQAQQVEQKARETLAAAEQAKRDAEAHLPKIAEITEKNAILGGRLKGAVEQLEEKKKQVRKLNKELKETKSNIEHWQNAYANANRDRVISDFGEPTFDD
jgi:hypothetical protein